MCHPTSSAATLMVQLSEKGDSVDVIFLDFAKAFDKVSHHHLLYKLQCYGIFLVS